MTTVVEDTEAHDAELISSWEWIGTPEKPVNPTPDEVRTLLASLPEVWGVKTVDFIDYVHGIGQGQTVKKLNQPDKKAWVVRLYMSVAGRIKMLEKAQEINNWTRVKLVPEPKTPTGIPGVLSMDDAVVYRVYCKVWGSMKVEELPPSYDTDHGLKIPGSTVTLLKPHLLGSRSGTSYRTGANAWEKAETAANGRAIAAWGLGVLPGSGVASLDEMQNPEVARFNRLEAQAEKKVNRDELIQEIAAIYVEAQTLLRLTDEQRLAGMKKFLADLQIKDAWDEQENQPVWSKVKTGVLMMWRDQQKQKLIEVKASATGLVTEPATDAP